MLEAIFSQNYTAIRYIALFSSKLGEIVNVQKRIGRHTNPGKQRKAFHGKALSGNPGDKE